MSAENAGFLLVPLITGLVEAAKRWGLARRHAPGLAIALGVALSAGGYAAGALGASGLYASIVEGAGYGLAAAGLYSAARLITGVTPLTRAEGRSRER